MLYPPAFAEGCEVCTCILWAVILSDVTWSTKHSTHILDDVSDGDRRDCPRQFSHDLEFREVVRQNEVVSPFDFEKMSVASTFHAFVGTSLAIIGSLRFATWCPWHTPQAFVILSMSSLIRGQYTDSRANIRVFSTPWCPLCNWLRMVPRIIAGIITCFPLNRTPSLIPSSSLNDQNERRSVGRSAILSGHPWYTTSANASRIGHQRVSHVIVAAWLDSCSPGQVTVRLLSSLVVPLG